MSTKIARYAGEKTIAAVAAGSEIFFTRGRTNVVKGLQMAGVSGNETSFKVGVTPGVIRKHYEKLKK